MIHAWKVLRPSRLIDAVRGEIGQGYSLRALKRSLEANCCKVNGKFERFASARLKIGDRIECQLLETVSAPPVTVLFESEELIVINKPPGCVSCEEAIGQALKKRVWLGHRLDKDTTGVLLLATSKELGDEVHALFKQRLMEKEYLALVDGIPREQEGTISSHLVKKKFFQGQTIWGSSVSDRGLFAQTHWTVLERRTDHALLRCRPVTGRTHQLRVHLAEMGHPILVDRQYAQHFRSEFTASRPLLHASSLSLVWRGQSLRFEAPQPAEFSN